MVATRPMAPSDETEVRAVCALAHPGWPERPPLWFFANPTIVAVDDDQIVGCASFTIDQTNTVMYLRDCAVLPAARGGGVGRLLMTGRTDIGKALGVQTFIGCTWETNTPMIRVFLSLGFHACQRVPGYFSHNTPPADGIIYASAHTGV